MLTQVSPTPGNDRDDSAEATSTPQRQDISAIWLRVFYDVPTAGIPHVTSVRHSLARNKDDGWDALSASSDAPIPWTQHTKRPRLSTVVKRIIKPISASFAALVHLEIVLPGKLLECVLRKLGDIDIPLLERLTVQDCLIDETTGHQSLVSNLFGNGAPRLHEVILTNVGWPEDALHAFGALFSLSHISDFPLTGDLGYIMRDCSLLTTLHIAAPSSEALPHGLGVMQDLKRVTATLDLGSLLALQDVLPDDMKYLSIAEYGAAVPCGILYLCMILFWIADRKISLYLSRNQFAVRCPALTGPIRAFQQVTDFLSIRWLRDALVPDVARLVKTLDMSLIHWVIIANALQGVELCALEQLTVRYGKADFVPNELPMHSQLTLRCPRLKIFYLQDLSLSWKLDLSNIKVFIKDCLGCETPEDVLICPRGVTIVSDTESRAFNGHTTLHTMLSKILANGGGPIDDLEFWEDPEHVLTRLAPQAYRQYRMGPHALTTARFA